MECVKYRETSHGAGGAQANPPVTVIRKVCPRQPPLQGGHDEAENELHTVGLTVHRGEARLP